MEDEFGNVCYVSGWVSVQLLREIDRADIPRISRRIRSVIQSTPPGSQYF